MPLIVQDLNQRFPIVDPKTGQPSDYFMRYLKDRGGYLSEIEGDIVALSEELNGRLINAGVGLSGGGPLSADVTLDLEDTAVTPGSYTNTSLTVDAQGRLTAASSGVASGGWTEVATWTHSSNVSSVTFTDLGAYSELLVVLQGVAATLSGVRRVRCSVDNGTSYYSTSGDYQDVATAGTGVNNDAIYIHSGATTAGRGGAIHIFASNVTGIDKTIHRVNVDAAAPMVLFVASNDPIDALEITNQSGLLSGGTISVLGK